MLQPPLLVLFCSSGMYICPINFKLKSTSLDQCSYNTILNKLLILPEGFFRTNLQYVYIIQLKLTYYSITVIPFINVNKSY